MAYTAEISRSNPSCLLFLIDQSGSMSDAYEGTQKKADAVADAINRLLANLCIKCSKDEGVRDYFHVGVIGYGEQVGIAFSGALAGRPLVPVSEVYPSPLRVEQRTKKKSDGAGGTYDEAVKFPVWFEPVARGGTPMTQALTLAKKTIEDWLAQHPNCFPPIVINITDGESTDGDPSSIAEEIKRLNSNDGAVLLFNAHISSRQAAAVLYPSSGTELPDKYGQQLFEMSSLLPDYMVNIAKTDGLPVSVGSRGFVFHADLVTVIQFLDIGTRPSALR